jgi:sugar lactone lactonase YvrE
MDRCSCGPRYAWLIATLLLVVGAREASAFYMPPVIDPKTYRSPSGRFEVTVDPSDVYGAGSAIYRFKENGKERWSTILPFTLIEAAVTESGATAGYAYTQTRYGWPKGPGPDDHGQFVVAMIGRDGKVRLKDAVKAEPILVVDAEGVNPNALGLIVDEPNDRMIVRIHSAKWDEIESWWIYRLSTATAVGKQELTKLWKDVGTRRHVLSVKPIRGAPLTLVHFYRSVVRLPTDNHEGLAVTTGATFALLDLQARLVWSLDLPTDYRAPDQDSHNKLYELLAEGRGIVCIDEPRKFDLYFAADSQRVSFAVTQRAAGDWTVKEMARSAYKLTAAPGPTLMTLRKQPLRPLKPILLPTRRDTPPSPIHDVHSFAFDNRGRIAFLRTHDDELPDLMLIDQQGTIVRQIALKTGVKGTSTWSGPCWVGRSRFVLANSENKSQGKTRAWWVDADSGHYDEFADFDCPRVGGLAGFADGSFVAVGDNLIAFDRQGHRLWTVQSETSSGKPEKLVQPEAVAATTNDEILVLEYRGPQVKCFDRAGKFLRTISLKSVLDDSANVVTGLSADLDGGLLIEHGKSPLARIDSDGTVRARLAPKYADARTIDTNEARIGPDGKIWATDGYCLVRLSDDGTVDRVVGESPQVNQLGAVSTIAIEPKGQIYAMDRRTGAIHVFDRAGKFRHICPAQSNDFGGLAWHPAISFGLNGDVYFGPGNEIEQEKCPYAHFGPHGERLKSVVWKGQSCLLQPASGHLISLSYHGAALTNQDGKTIRTLPRRADNCWLASPHVAALAADGSFAILTDQYEQGPPTINLFSAAGDPIRTIPLPGLTRWSIEMAYCGSRVAVAAQEGLFFFDRSGAALYRSDNPLPPRRDSTDEPHLLDDGKTLALFDGKNPVLYRYQLP